jgi:hypothetical protein
MSDQRSVIHVHTFLRPPDLKIGTPALPIFVGKLCIKSAIRIFFLPLLLPLKSTLSYGLSISGLYGELCENS